MPNFPNPFTGNTAERKMNSNELIQAIRIDIAGEFEFSISESLALRVRQPRAMCVLQG